MLNKRFVWIDWGRHARTHSLVARLGVELLELDERGRRLPRYLKCTRATLCYLHEARPTVVIATNPSLVLCCLLYLARPYFGFRLVLDAHFFGVTAPHGNRLHQFVLDYLNARANLVIVTNDQHAQDLERIGGRSYVCQDPLPTIPPVSSRDEGLAGKSAFLICSFDIDEPYEAVFEAFSELRDEGFALFVSGNVRKAQTDLSRYHWVTFLGFVPDAEYVRYLRLCDVVIDLTTNENCLVCGAYEAIAAEKPLVVSRTQAIAAYFGNAVVLTDHDSRSICASVRRAYADRAMLARATRTWAVENECYMRERTAGLAAMAGLS